MVIVRYSPVLLLAVRRRALRSCVWFKSLSSTERAILRLVPTYVRVIKSPKLFDIIARIVVKIQEALMSPLERFRRQVAVTLAQKISLTAQKWGNNSAKAWAENKAFIQYLALRIFD